MEDQVAEMMKITGGHFAVVFHANAGSSDVSVQTIQQPGIKTERFSTVGNV